MRIDRIGVAASAFDVRFVGFVQFGPLRRVAVYFCFACDFMQEIAFSNDIFVRAGTTLQFENLVRIDQVRICNLFLVVGINFDPLIGTAASCGYFPG